MKSLTESLAKLSDNPQWFKLSKEAKAEFKKIFEGEKRSQEAGFQFGGVLRVEE